MSQNLDTPPDEIDNSAGDEAKLEARLRIAFHRQDCPETMVLSKYQLDLLAETEKVQVAAHLKDCSYCQAEFSRLVNFLAEEIPMAIPAVEERSSPWQLEPEFVWQQFQETKQVVIRLAAGVVSTISERLQQGLYPTPPAFGRARRDDSRQLLFQLTLEEENVEDLKVIIVAESQPDEADHCTVRVQASIPSRGGWPHLAGTEVTLRQNEKIIGPQVTNAFGEAIFKEVAVVDLIHLTFEIKPVKSSS